MDTSIPVEFYGVPAGAGVMVVVAALERAGLPSRYAGIAAIVIATIIGMLVLVLSAHAALVAAGEGLVWGIFIVAAHKSVVDPAKSKG